MPSDLIKLIIKDFKQLKSLSLTREVIQQDSISYERLAVSRSVISLKLSNDCIRDQPYNNGLKDFLKGLIDHLLSIQNLSLIGSWRKFEVEIFSKSMRKL